MVSSLAATQIRRCGLWLCMALALAGLRPSASHAQVTWDATAGTSGPQDGSGTWSTADANWWNGSTNVVWPNLTTSSAIIGANSGAAGTITVSGSLAVNKITFNAPGSGAYTLTGGTLGFAGSSPTITANAAATIGSDITSGAGLTKSGTATLTLSGIVSNTAGAMNFNGGAVTLTGTLTNTSSSQFSIGGSNGGLLTIAGGSMSTSWSIARAIVIAPGSGQSGTIAMTSGALSASGLYIGENGGGHGAFTQSGGSATIGGGELWMAGNTSSLTVTGGSFTNNATTRLGVGSSGISTSTISVSGSGAITLGTLQFGIGGANGFTSTVNVGDGTAGGTLQVNGMLWGGATTTASTINFNSGTFVAGGSYSIPTQIATVVGSGGANINVAASRTLTISNTLAAGGGSGGLTKFGAGTLSLTGANTFTGATRINAGSLSIGNALALQNSTLDLDGADAGTVSAIGQNSTLGGLAGSRNLDMLTRTLSIGNNGASTTYSGVLSNGALTKIGAGTLTLAGANSYTGATTIDSGTLQIGAGGTTGAIAGTSTVTGSSGAVLAFSRTDNYGGNVSNNIGGGLGLTLNSGTLSLTGSNAYAGTTTINAGVLGLGAANALAGAGNIVFAGGTLQFTSSNVGDYAARIKNSGSSIALNTNGQNVAFAGSIDSTNTGGLVKSGGGTLTLSGSNAYSGGTTLTGGAMAIANANALGTGAFTTNVDADTAITFNLPTSGTVANGITILKPAGNRFYDFYQNQANNVALAGNIAVAAGNRLTFRLGNGLTSGTFTLTGSNTFGTDVFTGDNVTFRIGGTNAAGGQVWRPNLTTSLILLDGANFRGVIGNAIASYSMESSGTAIVSGNIFNRNTANVVVNTPSGAQLSFNNWMYAEGGNTTGTFTKTGAGTWVVGNSANNFTFNLNGGVLQAAGLASSLGASTAASFLVFDGGTLRYTGAATSTAKQFTLGANGGALDASGSGAVDFTSTAAVSFAGSGSRTLTLTGTNTGNNTLAAAIGNNGSDVVSLAKTGAGTWVLSGNNNYTGATTITAGRLRAVGNASLSANSAFSVASGAVLGLNGAAASIGSLAGAGTVENGHASTAAALTVGGDNTSTTFSGVIQNGAAAALGLTKAGSGRFTLASANSYTGATSISAGVLEIGSAGTINSTSGITVDGSTAELKYNSATALTQPLTLTQGTISGTGTIGAAVVFAAGDYLSPGNSPGTQAYTSQLTWSPLGTYQWELNALTGVAGTNWDFVNVSSGTFNLSGLSAVPGNQFVLDLITLDALNAAGPLAIPFDGGSYTLPIASYDPANFLLPTGFSNTAGTNLTSLFTINLAGWQGEKPQLGNVSVKINSTATGIDLVVVPEPGTLVFAGIGIAMAGWSIRNRRRAAR
jgi:fibronectin-binding autotransporter adhesin